MYYLADFKSLNEAEKEKKKIKTLGTVGGVGLYYTPPYRKAILNSMQEPFSRAKSAVRKSPEIQKELLKELIRTPDEIKNKTKIEDFQLERRLKQIFRERQLFDDDYFSDLMGNSQKARLNKYFKRIGIPPINNPNKDIGKYFKDENTGGKINEEYLKKLEALKNHPDIKDEKIRARMLKDLEKRYKAKGIALEIKGEDKTKLYKKVIRNKLVEAATRPIALGVGTGLTIGAITDIVGNIRRDKVAKKKNIKLDKPKNEKIKTAIKGTIGLGLLGYGALSRKKGIVKSFLRRNKKGTVSNVKGHTRSLGGN